MSVWIDLSWIENKMRLCGNDDLCASLFPLVRLSDFFSDVNLTSIHAQLWATLFLFGLMMR